MPVAALSMRSQETIVVDLDGTLVLTDTFVASLIEALRTRPLNILALFLALLRGRASCKRLSAALGPVNVASLPYNEPLIKYLRQQRATGSRLILATGADLSIASRVAEHLGIFDEIIASDGQRNMVGEEKLRAIRGKLGDVPFKYAGNSRADLKVWRRCESAILIGDPRGCVRELRAAGVEVHREFAGSRGNWRSLLRCLRVHQWSKNVLIFVPVLLAHRLLDAVALRQSFIGFLAFSCCASALYVVNDLLDLPADRLHPTKRFRPLASGELSVQAGLVLGGAAALAAAAFASLLPLSAIALLAVYAASSLIYSFKLKRMLFIDVVSLALFYVLRVLYGGSATGIKISVWTLAFSLFLFLSLATVKRLAELRRVKPTPPGTPANRAYAEIDIVQLSSLAAASGYVAVLVFALYINSPEVALLYRHAQALWLLCPILIYWISRLTLIANRGSLDDDPVTFALKDRATWVVGLLAAVILVVST